VVGKEDEKQRGKLVKAVDGVKEVTHPCCRLTDGVDGIGSLPRSLPFPPYWRMISV
jgi:hypothetical protein